MEHARVDLNDLDANDFSSLLRPGETATSVHAFNRVRSASLRHLKRFRGGLSDAVLEEIVNDAIVEFIEGNRESSASVATLQSTLRRALDAFRKREHRRAARFVEGDASTEKGYDAPAERGIARERAESIIRVVNSAMQEALSMVPKSTRELLTKDIGRDQSSLVIRSSTGDTTRMRDARTRALKSLSEALVRILMSRRNEALGRGSRQDDGLEDALLVLGDNRLGDLFEYLERDVSKPHPARERSVSHHELTSVSPPWLFIVWDPAILSPGDYEEITAALGDLVRAHGGVGLKLIRSLGLGVQVEEGIPV